MEAFWAVLEASRIVFGLWGHRGCRATGEERVVGYQVQCGEDVAEAFVKPRLVGLQNCFAWGRGRGCRSESVM